MHEQALRGRSPCEIREQADAAGPFGQGELHVMIYFPSTAMSLRSGLAGVRDLTDLLLLDRLPALTHGLVHAIVSALSVNAVRVFIFLLQILLPHHHILAAGLGLPALPWPVAFGLVAGSHIHAAHRFSEQALLEGVTNLAGGGAEGEEAFVVLYFLLLDHRLYLGGLQGNVVVEAFEQVALDR